MIDTPITKKFFRKIELYLELKRQDKRVKRSDRGEMIWKMEKYILLWAVKGHWHLGTPLTSEYIGDRLIEGGFKNDELVWTRQVMQNLMARNFAYHPENEQDKDIIQIKDEGFLMGEVIEEAKSKKEYIYILFSFFVWFAVIVAALKILSELVNIISDIIYGWIWIIPLESNYFYNMNIIYNLSFWSALSGLVGAILMFFFGLPPKIDPDGHIHLILEQEDENEKKKAKIYKIISYCGILLLGLSFAFQLASIILKK